jgi:hypothetical protein
MTKTAKKLRPSRKAVALAYLRSRARANLLKRDPFRHEDVEAANILAVALNEVGKSFAARARYARTMLPALRAAKPGYFPRTSEAIWVTIAEGLSRTTDKMLATQLAKDLGRSMGTPNLYMSVNAFSVVRPLKPARHDLLARVSRPGSIAMLVL